MADPNFKPIARLWDQVEDARRDSDTALWFKLMVAGEMVFRTIVAFMVAAIKDDPDRYRYG